MMNRMPTKRVSPLKKTAEYDRHNCVDYGTKITVFKLGLLENDTIINIIIW